LNNSRSKPNLQNSLNLNPLSVPSAIAANGALGLVGSHQGLPLNNSGHPNLLTVAAAAAANAAAVAAAAGNSSHSSPHHPLALTSTSASSGIGSFQNTSHQFGLPDNDYSVNKRPRLFVDNKFQPLLIETNNMVEIKKVCITTLSVVELECQI
jgi:hypothetical protein